MNNISGTANPACFTGTVPSQAHHMYNISDQDIASSSLDQATTSSSSESHVSSILYNFSLLKEKVQHVQSLMSILISPDQNQPVPESTSIAVASIGTLVQEIIVNASSMMLTCQQMYNNNSVESSHQQQQPQPLRFSEGSFSQLINFDINRTSIDSLGQERGHSFSSGMFDWYGNNVDSCNSNFKDNNRGIHIEHKEKKRELVQRGENNEGTLQGFLTNDNNNCDIIELDAADLLAKYTHYCQVCGKGFKRDANLRMHMRAHGDEYKSAAALSNPMKKNGNDSGNEDISVKFPRKYSCPHEGCRWNQKHAKFQPLKSIICVKNHYKRSHCPKMYVCKRCNRKQFSILSDLRTHEKHCGNLKWQCSCGTTFSRKDKLMGHVNLFVGHTPLINLTTRQGN